MDARIDCSSLTDFPGARAIDPAETHPPHPQPFSRAGEKGAETLLGVGKPKTPFQGRGSTWGFIHSNSLPHRTRSRCPLSYAFRWF